MKTPRIKDGEGFEVELGEVFRFGCCDCGLTHRMVICQEKNGRLGVALERHSRSTAQRRRWISKEQISKLFRWFSPTP